ncbi:histone deacetylase family protein [Erythrobacter sp. 3-20A1M]|uniref:histone deacetylase family protein n=1 Tax=Erythrobacter sp. 3-20A1M TaxID=2653850 RepID=UPI001BFC6CBB|nr:histone deacetylase family protein [Erythrobacter sp. 3-20A1M]QWC57225.1 histone deacetylase family protein [Erythrobacter sp. 3-20A1M]
MRVFSDPAQVEHAPTRELHNGGWMDYAEVPARLTSVLDACGPGEPARDFGIEPILAAHDPAYVAFLRDAYRQWRAAGREGDAMGYVFPIVARRKLELERIDAKIGAYSTDASTPIAAGTWDAAYGAAQSALTGMDAVLTGDRAAFALCRPPGHHAGADYMGGYCYLNNAAIAARAAQARGAGRVAILDVDYHHGNGTQDIFYEDGEVLFASIHADPKTDFPFYWGHADERGAGAGEGATLNLPLPQGTEWSGYAPALEKALATVRAHGPDLLVISYGADTFAGDPISQFRLHRDDYTAMAGMIAALGVPTLIVMEGGYAVDALGSNVAAFLAGWG